MIRRPPLLGPKSRFGSSILAALALAVAFLGGCSGDNDTTPAKVIAGEDGISFKLEGCRNDGSPLITLPDGDGKFICPDAVYTTGNLGPNWFELDIVPYRITAQSGNAAPDEPQQYTKGIVLDNCEKVASPHPYQCATGDTGHPGFDVISAPTLNTALSDEGCTEASSTAQTSLDPGVGGTDVSIYRLITITQPKNTTCVYDFYGRVALGARLYPGASLHANLLASDLNVQGTGAKEVSLPKNEIGQSVGKTMTASQGTSQTWAIGKSGPSSADFGNVCVAANREPKAVDITVTWTKVALVPGNISAVATITATNPASRPIGIDVSDALYLGPTVDPYTDPALDTEDFDVVTIPARSTVTIGTHTVSLPSTTASIGDYLSDVATASFVDEATGVPVIGATRATYQAQIQSGTTANVYARASDSEGITGSGLTFAVATPTVGGFTGGYVAGTATTGPVGWDSDPTLAAGEDGTIAANGSVVFKKTVYLGTPWITTGQLTDTANLTGSDGFTAAPSVFELNITSTAAVSLTISKTMPSGFLMGTDEAYAPFHIEGPNDYTHDLTLTFVGSDTSESVTLNNLEPGVYTVTEGTVTYSNAVYPSVVTTSNPQTVDLTVPAATGTDPFANCSGTASFVNEVCPNCLATAQVQKTTFPALTSEDADYTWSFRLQGPGGVDETVTAGAGAGNVAFTSDLIREGTYTITETAKTGWDLADVAPGETLVCTFEVDYPVSEGQTYGCNFTNYERAHANVVKTVQGYALTGLQSFTFQLRQGASLTAAGTTLESVVADAGNGGTVAFTTSLQTYGSHTYQFCEIVMPGWQTSLPTPFVPNSYLSDGTTPNPDVDNSVLCVNFTPDPGQTVTFTVDNTPPPGGLARTIGFWKNHASCKQSNGNQEPVLDETLALFPVATGQATAGVFIGGLYVDTCAEAVSLLSKDNLLGFKMARYPAFGLAAQLLAARLNIEAGAATCAAANEAMTQGQALLDTLGFNGMGPTNVPKMTAYALRGFAATLDTYNNNLLCGS